MYGVPKYAAGKIGLVKKTFGDSWKIYGILGVKTYVGFNKNEAVQLYMLDTEEVARMTL